MRYEGNFSFKRQVGATGPAPDQTYHLNRRSETWQGKETDLEAFLATKPLGSAHPANSALKLASYEPRFLEAGMVDVSFNYVGSATSPGPVTKRRQNLLKTGSISGKVVRRFERVSSFTTSVSGAITSESWGWVEQEIEAELQYTYYTPSITFRYCANEDIKEAQFTASAEMAGLEPRIENKSQKITGQQWVTRSGMETASDLTGIKIRSLTTRFETADGVEIGTPTLRATDMNSNQVGLSGWYEVEETHEFDLV